MSTLKCLLTICCIFSFASFELSAEKPLYFEEEGRNWIFAGVTRVGEKTFVPEGEDPENWDEAIILHHISSGDIPLVLYYETFIKILNEKSKNIFQSRIIEEDEDSLVFEWWVNHESPGAQHGWIKVSKTAYGLQFFRYTTKKIQNIANVKSTWEEILRNYNFTITPESINYDININNDGRVWNVIDDKKMKKKYFLEGESENGWSERLIVNIFPFSGESPYSFYHKTIAELEKNSGKTINSKIIDSNSQGIFFEWWFDQSQHEWFKLNSITPNLAAGMKYTNRNQQTIEKQRETWETIMKNSNVNVKFKYEMIRENHDQNDLEN